jgi:succinoglycan biosynthesis transport protein ExoP
MAAGPFDTSDDTGVPERAQLLPAAPAPGRAAPVGMVQLRSGFGRVASKREFDPRLFLKSFRRRWPLATGMGILLAAVVGCGVWLALPAAKYSTQSVLRVSMHPPKIIFNTSEVLADYRTFQKTQTELIRSRYVLGPASRDPRVTNLRIIREQPDPAEWLERQIQVSFPSGSELLVISMTSANPEELEPIVNSVVEAYMVTVVEEEHKARRDRLDQLKTMLEVYRKELKSSRESIRKSADQLGSDDRATLVMKQGFMLENLHQLERELLAIQAELRKYNSYVAVIRAKQKEEQAAKRPTAAADPADRPDGAGAALARDAAVEARVEADPQTLTLRAQVDRLAREYTRFREKYRDPIDPAVTVKRAALQSARTDLDAHRDRLRQAHRNGVGPGADGPAVGESPASDLALLNDRVDVLRRNEAELAKEVERYRLEIVKLNGQTIDLQNEQDQIQISDATTKRIGAEVEALEVELKAPRRIKKLADAEPARKKDNSRQAMICGGASFGAFALALMAVSFWEMKAMRIGSVDEVVTDLGLTLVGTLPALPTRGTKLSKADDQRWQGMLVESIDATRTMILHASRVHSIRAVMITSAMKGEGKTSLAAHLATSLARAGRKTLLIDCDLRRPALHQLFDVARTPGLCELLRGEYEINDVVRPTPAEELNLIPAGLCDGISLQAIAQDGFRDILTVLKKRYDFIIIDSAPVLPVVDTMLVSQQVDAVLFSVMRDVSRVPLVQAAHERLATLGVKMLGAVVSAAERRDYMHTYDYEYQGHGQA